MPIAQTIKATRKAHKLTQRAIAHELGVDYTYISKLENNKADYPPSDRFLATFAAKFDLDQNRLMFECGRIPEEMQKVIAAQLLEEMEQRDRD